MERKIVFHKEFNEIINKLPDNDKIIIKSAIRQYLLDYKEPDLDGYLSDLFKYIKPANIDRSQIIRRKFRASQLLIRANNCQSYRSRICRKILEKYKIPKHCFYCGDIQKLQIDHIIPRCEGGKDEIANLVYSCLKCNARKGSKSLQSYREYLERIASSSIKFFGEV